MMRVLIIGTGSIGKKHFEVVRKVSPNSEIMMYSPSGKAFISELKCIFTNNIENAIKFQPSLVIVASPSNTHIEYADLFIGHANGVLIEKPIAASLLEARAFADTLKESTTYIQVGYNLKYFKSLNLFRKIIRSNEFGVLYTLKSYVAQHLTTWRTSKDYRHTVSANKLKGGGVLLELSHEIDYLMWIMGRPVALCARVAKYSDMEIDVEDYAAVDFFYNRPVSGEIVPVRLEMNFIDHKAERNCTAIFKDATVRWDGLSGSVQVFHKDKSVPTTIFHSDNELFDSYVNQFSRFSQMASEKYRWKLSKENVDCATNVIEIIDKIWVSHNAKGRLITV
ncbi:Gfo/Idh/MocA family oxidoreductase [Alphaproteobacteria bacterium]|nr:Gfo/Idh/MocA family oxidoreductase [Alphaproteobacteria bacterium]